jgi:hypothetical protein
MGTQARPKLYCRQSHPFPPLDEELPDVGEIVFVEKIGKISKKNSQNKVKMQAARTQLQTWNRPAYRR